MTKKIISFSIEEEVWEECQRLKKERKIRFSWSYIVEECLRENIEYIKSCDPELMEIFEKETTNLDDIKKVRFGSIEKIKKDIQNENRKFILKVESSLNDMTDILRHLERREEKIRLSGEEQIEKPPFSDDDPPNP